MHNAHKYSHVCMCSLFIAGRSHEWLKHGTCASGIDCMSTEKGFFSTVLELHQTKMDFSAVLSSQGIYPSRDHTFKVQIAFLEVLYVTRACM